MDVLNKSCTAEGDNPPFNFGIFTEAKSSKTIAVPHLYAYLIKNRQHLGRRKLVQRKNNLCSTLGQGLETGTFALKILFSIGIGIFGLILFGLCPSDWKYTGEAYTSFVLDCYNYTLLKHSFSVSQKM
ncbi:hypothetical protein L3X38_016896 [Prunus dulcis]|uniref:Uncharacterized protein n=1 Tax=Prunus dulcis TaxID=3755 RepID=A0AAD4W654_PRUDU|nr:hypothetical protein L3X38_016896 [Prunus dulcis]